MHKIHFVGYLVHLYDVLVHVANAHCMGLHTFDSVPSQSGPYTLNQENFGIDKLSIAGFRHFLSVLFSSVQFETRRYESVPTQLYEL